MKLNAKEKAEELVEKFTDIENKYKEYSDFKQAKQCALIAVDEAEKSEYNVLTKFEIVSQKYTSAYWQEVKTEIEKL